MDDEKIFTYTTSFNSILKRFIKFACDKSLTLRTSRLKGRVSLIINDAPFLVLEKTGPYMLRYAKHIKERDEQFFLNEDFSEHYDDEDDETRKDIIGLIDQVRKIYKRCSDKEKEHLNDLADDLLIAYCTYLSHIRSKK